MLYARMSALSVAVVVAVATMLGCGGSADRPRPVDEAVLPTAERSSGGRMAERAARPATEIDVYAHTRAGMLSAAASRHQERIYVPNSEDDTVSVIDPRRMRVVRTFAVGALPHHVTPSHDLKTLYVNNTQGNTLTAIDPKTAKPAGEPIPVDDPYNLYFTPDGRSAIVIAERLQRLDFRHPRTWKLQKSVPAGCVGVDHMDFSADGRRAVASCEFDGTLLLLDVERRKILKRMRLDAPGSKPVDVRLSPDGKLFYVADEVANGVWKVDAKRFRVRGFIRTGRGTHGLYPSRDATVLYATNRLAGTVSVIGLANRRVKATWRILAVAAPTWAASPPTASAYGSAAATTRRSTSSTPTTAGSSSAFPSVPAPTACSCGPSPGATRSATPATCAEHLATSAGAQGGPGLERRT